MSQPPRYVRGESFIEYAAAHPAAPFPPANLEAELDDVQQTLDATLDNLALIQRDDGNFVNGSIHSDAFSTDSLALMGGSWTPRGLWVTAHAYVASDVVEQGSIAYVCAIAHNSGVFNTDHTAGKWIVLGVTGASMPFTPAGTITATNVQAAVEEVSGDVTALTGAVAALAASVAALWPAKADIGGDTALTAADKRIPKKITASAIVTLPLSSVCDVGDPFIFKSYTHGNVLIAPAGADTLDGVAASIRLASYEVLELIPDGGTDWIVTKKPAWEVGNVKAHDGGTIPLGWIARGASVARATYASLFTICGTTFDAGDGLTTFGAGGVSAGRALIGDGTGTSVASGVNADVDTSADTLTVAANTDKWNTGMALVFTLAAGTITGLVHNTTYFAVRSSSTAIKLATSLANAQNGVTIDLTAKAAPVWTITHTLTSRTLGEAFGTESKAMTSAELVAHLHTDSGHTHGATSGGSFRGTTGANSVANGVSFPANGETIAAASAAITATGGNAAMRVQNPGSVTKFIIKT